MNEPEEAEGYLSRAELLIELGRFDEARDELAAVLSLHPHHGRALTLLALVELGADEPEDALTAAGAALAIEELDDDAIIARGHALARLGRVEEAVATAERLLDVDRTAWWRHTHYALIRREARNGQEALDAAWEAIRIAPDEPQAHTALAVIAADLGLDDLAERAARAAVRLRDESPPGGGGDRYLLAGLLGFQPWRVTPPETPGADGPVVPPAVVRPPDGARERLAILVRYGAAFPIGVPLVIAIVSGGLAGPARALAAVFGVFGGVGMGLLARRWWGPISRVLRGQDGGDRWLEIGLACVAASPLTLLAFAAVASPYLLGLTILLGFAGLFTMFLRWR